MTAPTVDAYAQRTYDALEPLTYADAELGYPLLVFCGAIGAMYQPIDNIARDSANGPGWSSVLDVDLCPVEWLPWLAQIVGATINPALAEDEQRNQIRNPSGFVRGTLQAIAAAPMPYLTGTKSVIIRERDPAACSTEPAYGLTVITFTDETADEDAVLAALIAQKPAGIILNYQLEDGLDFESVRTTYATFEDLRTTFTTFDAMRVDHP